MMIKKVIVESLNGRTILVSRLQNPCTEDELRQGMADEQLYVMSVNVDTVGTALVVIGQNYFG